MDNKGSFKPIVVVMLLSLLIVWLWNKVPAISETAHKILDPSVGVLLNWNVTWGMIILVFGISVFMTLVQKYATDQKTLKELKKEQKILQAEMKKYKEHPEKLMELQKKQLEFIPKTFQLTSRSIMFTGVPLILFFRWFGDYFMTIPDFRFFGFFTWIWFYLILTLVFSSILRKFMDVA
ncbi:MAG: hypothetical protein U9Q06_03480 [Nanoarchaeota archaeon]|nr:hypothetical protein [Nanoarchaeota archaeon]